MSDLGSPEESPLSQRDWFIQFFVGQGTSEQEAVDLADQNIAALEQMFPVNP